jgi:anionic cell wall polymer biosynthesis LytR-Cps2A-Psr (LCP) family protein
MKFIPITVLLVFLYSSPAYSTMVQYSYDNLSQLSTARYSNGTNFQYTYDSLGNREQASVSMTGVPFGDIDGNSTVDLTDLIIGLQICSGETPSTIILQSDVNGNSQVDISEVLYILQQLKQ